MECSDGKPHVILDSLLTPFAQYICEGITMSQAVLVLVRTPTYLRGKKTDERRNVVQAFNLRLPPNF